MNFIEQAELNVINDINNNWHHLKYFRYNWNCSSCFAGNYIELSCPVLTLY